MDTRLSRAVLVMISLAGCASSAPAPETPQRFENPKPLVAHTDAKTGVRPSTICAGGPKYDAHLGCVRAGSGVPVRVSFDNTISRAFRLTGVALALDGERMFETNDPALFEQKRFITFSTRVRPATEHELDIRVYYRGHGYGVFAYLKRYRFEIAAAKHFQVKAGQDSELSVVAYERGSVLTNVHERPAVRLEVDR